MSTLQKLQTAITEPSRIAPYLRHQLQSVRCGWATRRRAGHLLDQRELIDARRQADEWLLVILDACRYDEFARVYQSVAPSDEAVGKPFRVRSAGRDTFEYVAEVWDGQYPDVTYISGATPVNSVDIEYEDRGLRDLANGYLPTEHIGEIVDVWNDGWDDSLGTVPPAAVTDAAIERDADEMVVHYYQPHTPYIGEPQLLGHTGPGDGEAFTGEPTDKPIWERAKAGAIHPHNLRAAYRGNLKLVCSEVRRLLFALDHDLAIVTADHGEALGEFGIYGHPRDVQHPHVRVVPWLEVR